MEEMVTRNSEGQPSARFDGTAVRLSIPALPHAGLRRREVRLSAAKAEELAIELEHAAKMMRGEI